MSVSYEVMVQITGKWRNESVTPDKDDAISRAEDTFARGKVEAVKVIEETHDESTGESREKVVFNKSRSGPEPKRGPSKKKKTESDGERRRDERRKKIKKKSRRSLGDLILIMCLGAISLISSAGMIICIASK